MVTMITSLLEEMVKLSPRVDLTCHSEVIRPSEALGSNTGCVALKPTTQIGTRTHCLLIEITHLVSGLNEAQVLYVWSQKEFSERQSDR